MRKGDFTVMIYDVNGICANKDTGNVALPFDTEYSIYLHNRNHRRAVASVTIDGELVGEWIINAHSGATIERPIKHNRKFKFVRANSGAAHAAGKSGGAPTNGLIVVNWRYEKQYLKAVAPGYTYGYLRSFDATPQFASNCCSREGVTVGGARSSQQFQSETIDVEDGIAATITLRIRGYEETPCGYSVDIDAPDVPLDKFCTKCGWKRVEGAKFCGGCGYHL